MKSAGKARNNGLYRHIRTSKEIIRNLLNDYYKDSFLFAQVREKYRLRAAGTKGPFSFAKENGPFGTPRERLRLSVSGLKDSYASGMKMPARGFAAFRAAIRFASASIIRCRSAYLVDVRSNSRLLRHSLMRRAQQCRIPHAVCRQTNITRASR